MSDFVFLGPTLPRAEAESILPAEYLPPVSMGDLYVLTRTRAKAGDRVAIVDGFFEQLPAVWHKEVLDALDRGIHVYGASSMGALRAAELHPFGMVGVGRIFEAYRSDAIADDDEVAVAHAAADQGYRSVSTAMVTIRFGLSDLRDEGKLTDAACAALIEGAKALPYGERSWGGVLAQARDLGLGAEALDALKAKARSYDAKAEDARALLARLAAEAGRSEPFQADFAFETTPFWVALQRTAEPRIAEARVPGAGGAGLGASQAELQMIRAASPHRDRLFDSAAFMMLAHNLTDGWSPSAPELRAAAQRLRHRHRLRSRAEVEAWRSAQALDDPAWSSLVEAEARCVRVIDDLLPQLDRDIVTAAKREGVFAEVAAEARAGRELLESRGIAKPTLADAGIDSDVLERWYVERCGGMLPDPESHAHRLGFESLRDFVTVLVTAYLASPQPGGAGAAEAGPPGTAAA